MGWIIQTLVVGVLLLFFNITVIHAQIINEICPVSSSNHPYEWVEVFNDTDASIDTSTLSIVDEKNHKLTWSTAQIEPHGYSLATASAVLNNTGDAISIKNQNGDSIATASYTGSFSAETSFVRCSDNQWLFSNTPSPLSNNDTSCSQPSITTQIQNSQQQDYNLIYLSEAMVNPATDQNEWVEIFNTNAFEVHLNNWAVDDDKDQGSNPFIFSLTVAPSSYGIIDVDKTMFNNDQDTVRLLNASGIEKDSMHYAASEKEKTIGKSDITSATVCIQQPSRGYSNSSCLSEDNQRTNSTPQPTPVATLTRLQIPSQMDSSDSYQDATDEDKLATNASLFALPFFGKVKGITTKKISSPSKPATRKQLKTASSFAATSLMFSWANICYILFKIRKKYQSYNENLET